MSKPLYEDTQAWYPQHLTWQFFTVLVRLQLTTFTQLLIHLPSGEEFCKKYEGTP